MERRDAHVEYGSAHESYGTRIRKSELRALNRHRTKLKSDSEEWFALWSLFSLPGLFFAATSGWGVGTMLLAGFVYTVLGSLLGLLPIPVWWLRLGVCLCGTAALFNGFAMILVPVPVLLTVAVVGSIISTARMLA